MKEKWAQFIGYEGLYDVSTYGRVRSHPRNGTQAKKIHILKPSTSKTGYKRVTLSKNNNATYVSIHRLVAQTFLDNRDNKKEVNHIDGDRSNNKLSNLEWVTSSENHLHRIYKLNSNCLKECRRVRCLETNTVYSSIREASRAMHCDHKSIQRAAAGLYTKANNLHWEYQ